MNFVTPQSAVSLCPAIMLWTFLITSGFQMILSQFIVIKSGQSILSSNNLLTSWSHTLSPPG